MDELITSWEDLGNTYGTLEGGWKTPQEAGRALSALWEHGYKPEETVVIGRVGEDGWEPADPSHSERYDHFCITDNTGEYVLQPGEDDGERTEEGVERLAPPKGWVWVFVA